MACTIATADCFYPEQPMAGGWSQDFGDGSSGQWCPAQWAVLDTNQVLGNFEAVQYILTSVTGVNLVVPRIVIKELELMQCLEEASGSSHARTALRFLQTQLLALEGFWSSSAADRSTLVLQGENEAIYQGLLGPKMRSKSVAIPDDHVLACARYFAKVTPEGSTEVLTSDCKLAIDASYHGVPSESVLDLMGRYMQFQMTTSTEHVAEHAAKSFRLPDSDSDSEEKARHAIVPPSFLDAPSSSSFPKRVDIQAPPGLKDTNGYKQSECSSKLCAQTCGQSTDDASVESLSAASEDENEKKESEDRVDKEESRSAANDAASVVLRGLPLNVAKDEVLAFVLKAGISRSLLDPGGFVKLLENAPGRPSGFVEVRLAPSADPQDMKARLHMQLHRGRYVEAFPSRPAQ